MPTEIQPVDVRIRGVAAVILALGVVRLVLVAYGLASGRTSLGSAGEALRMVAAVVAALAFAGPMLVVVSPAARSAVIAFGAATVGVLAALVNAAIRVLVAGPEQGDLWLWGGPVSTVVWALGVAAVTLLCAALSTQYETALLGRRRRRTPAAAASRRLRPPPPS